MCEFIFLPAHADIGDIHAAFAKTTTGRVCKKCFLENFAKFTCARISFSIKLQATLAQMFSCEFCEIFENGLFYNTPLVED